MREVGGYFELESEGKGSFPLSDGMLLNTGRNALEYILLSLADVKRVFVPYYTCPVVLEPLEKLGIPYSFCHIDDRLELADDVQLIDGQYLIVNNYFGIKDSYINSLLDKYGDRLIVDCAQSLFFPSKEGVKAFYSPRKFVGVPDGGVACGVSSSLYSDLQQDDSSGRTDHLIIRKKNGAQAGYQFFKEAEASLSFEKMKKMSLLSRNILSRIDYQKVVSIRRNNFNFLHAHLVAINKLKIINSNSFVCPMAYPLMCEDSEMIRRSLIEQRIFVPTYWPGLLDEATAESHIADSIIPLPIDQRYSLEDMIRILHVIDSIRT